jgi:fluoroquinolone transport system ATP-binding protein
MITVEHLYHSYSKDSVYAVKDVSFEIPKGEVFGFLGPSGAGKSTTQGVLTGLLRLQQGHVTVGGFDVKKIKRSMFNQIGMSFEQSNVYSKMTARENLTFYAKLFDVPPGTRTICCSWSDWKGRAISGPANFPRA